jgi:hypothetical protein
VLYAPHYVCTHEGNPKFFVDVRRIITGQIAVWLFSWPVITRKKKRQQAANSSSSSAPLLAPLHASSISWSTSKWLYFDHGCLKSVCRTRNRARVRTGFWVRLHWAARSGASAWLAVDVSPRESIFPSWTGNAR